MVSRPVVLMQFGASQLAVPIPRANGHVSGSVTMGGKVALDRCQDNSAPVCEALVMGSRPVLMEARQRHLGIRPKALKIVSKEDGLILLRSEHADNSPF